MKNIKEKIKTLKEKEKIAQEKIVNIENEIENIKNQIINIIKINNTKKIEISESTFINNDGILINITPKSAWTDVINFKVLKDNKIIFQPSAGGWENEENAFIETREILNHIYNIKNEILELGNKIFELLEEKTEIKYKVLNKIKDELKELEREEIIQNNNFKKLEIKDLDNNKDKELTLYRINFNNKIEILNIWYDKQSRRWTDGYMHFTRKELVNTYYIKQ